MARKPTSAAVQALASRVLNESPFNADMHAAIADAIQGSGLPLNDRAVLAITNKIEAALETVVEDMRTLANALTTPDGFSVPSQSE